MISVAVFMTPNKLIVILGPTASGKTDLSIKLAKKLALSKNEGFNGVEIVSADSRQVYKGLNIGSGKITKKEMQGITHYLLDIANPKRKFTVAQYQKLAFKAIEKIHKKEKIPFLVGGSGFYIKSIVDGILIPEIKPDWKLRKKLVKKTAEELFLILKKLDPKRAKLIDKKNPRRLIRAIEIVLKTGKPVPQFPTMFDVAGFEVLQIGIKKSSEELKKTIQKRLRKRLKQGLIHEVKNLQKNGLPWKRLEELGLEYRFVAQYLQSKLSYKEMQSKLEKEIWHFSKRQMTWFKKHSAPEQVRYRASKRIHWIKNQKEAENLVKKFVK